MLIESGDSPVLLHPICYAHTVPYLLRASRAISPMRAQYLLRFCRAVLSPTRQPCSIFYLPPVLSPALPYLLRFSCAICPPRQPHDVRP